MLPINPDLLASADQLAPKFQAALPFRHIFMRDFFVPGFADSILAEFPEPDLDSLRNEFGDLSRKHVQESIRQLGPSFQRWDATLKSKVFVHWLESVTGIDNLIFDPRYEGAGIHSNFDGQSLDLHIDFNRHHGTGHHRRLNLIVYLCEHWDPAWGGCLELHEDAWDRSGKSVSVSYPPFKNHAVLFETNEHSWHGFKEISLPPSKRHLSRKSLTVYYYSRSRPKEERALAHSTVYVPDWIPDEIRPGEVLTPEAYQKLERHLTERDQFLRRLYQRETQIHDKYFKLLRLLHPLRQVLVLFHLEGFVKRLFDQDNRK